ncbi:SDR family oxidoreductase [Nocardia sp. 004]|uniref:SDR family oxidoreductase n=1 Tax=Nocardia sp. 004 TaxID=3385978 RepID=UPI0039A32C3B
MSRLLRTQVAVVGAGPVGLTLAGELGLAGIDVLVLERLAEPGTESRASTLHARTMEMFELRGLLGRFGELPNEPMGHFGGIPLPLTGPGPYPGQWKSPQTETVAVLREWARGLGARILDAHELRGLSQHDSGVLATVSTPEGPCTVEADAVVGCDGEHSTVRRLAGIPLRGRAADKQMHRMDLTGIDIPGRRFQRLPGGLAVAARRGEVTRVMVHEFGARPSADGTEPGFAEICAVWRRVTGEDIGAATPIWVDSFGNVSRQAESYRSGRVLLAGDAAHRQMPVGGQAMNLGIQDAFNLGWKLAAYLHGYGGEPLLDSYHRERHAAGAKVLADIEAQTTLLLEGPRIEPLRQVFTVLLDQREVQHTLAAAISGVDLDYAALDSEHPPAVASATRVDPRSITSARARTALRAGLGVLLDRSEDEHAHQRLDSALRGYRDRIVVARDTERPAEYPLRQLIRPDGYAAWATDGAEELPAPHLLAHWFGPERAPVANGQVPNTDTPRKHLSKNISRSEYTMNRLAGKTALVTGAGRNIGRAIAIRLAADGALVAVHYSTSKDEAADTVAAIEKDGGRAFAIHAELGEQAGIHQLFFELEQGLKQRTGSTELNIVVNNAGVMGGTTPEETTPEQFDRLFAVNAKAPFFILQRATALLSDNARIINISSGLTRVANPAEVAYAMTKGAIEQLTLHMAKHLAQRGITVNSVAPGITRNDNPVFGIPKVVEQMAALSAFNRVGEPSDIADTVAFLVSDDARWITGSCLDASGGTLLG